MHPDSFASRTTLSAAGSTYTYFSLEALRAKGVGHLDRLPFSLKILLENLLRLEDGRAVTRDDIEALASWQPNSGTDREIAFTPAVVLLQTSPACRVVVDLARCVTPSRSAATLPASPSSASTS